jgi:hypothetical protein
VPQGGRFALFALRAPSSMIALSAATICLDAAKWIGQGCHPSNARAINAAARKGSAGWTKGASRGNGDWHRASLISSIISPSRATSMLARNNDCGCQSSNGVRPRRELEARAANFIGPRPLGVQRVQPARSYRLVSHRLAPSRCLSISTLASRFILLSQWLRIAFIKKQLYHPPAVAHAPT